MALTGRPYQLHAGDLIQIRHTLAHPTAGRLANGSPGQVAEVDHHHHQVRIQLDHGPDAWLDRDQLDHAQVRLAYVQHPFPAQGQTTHTAHLLVGPHATHNGSYVALTRARHRTTI